MSPAPPKARPASLLRRLSLATFIALRIVRSRRSPTLSLVTMISVIGIGFGVWALTIVLSVTAGFEGAYHDRILGLFPHLVVTSESSRFDNYEPILDRIRTTEGVLGASPVTGDSMMVSNGKVYRAGATIQGVDPATIGDVIELDGLITTGALSDLAETPRVRVEGATVHIDDLVEHTWTTVVLRDKGPPVLLSEERVVPDAGHARVRLMDLRVGTPAGPPPGLKPISGEAVTTFKLTHPLELPLSEVDGIRQSVPIELPAGDWELTTTGARFDLARDTLVTVLLVSEAEGTGWRLMVEDAKTERIDRTASLRTIDGRSHGTPVTVTVGAGDEALSQTVSPGEFTAFGRAAGRLPGVILGFTLAERLHAKVGDELSLVSPYRGISGKMSGPFGMLPSSSRFRMAGTFRAGFHDHDSKLAIINMAVSQRFLNRGKLIHSIAVKTANLLDISETKARVSRAIDPMAFEDLVSNTASFDHKLRTLVQPGFSPKRLTASNTFVGGLRNVSEAVNLLRFQRSDYATQNRFRIHDWKEKNVNLFSALELQKVVLTMFFLIIIVVGSFVVVGSQIMVVYEKTADIAILKAMGATRGLVRLTFTLQGLFVALTGAAFGLVIGLGTVALIDSVDYQLDASIYLIDTLPTRVDIGELVMVVAGTLLCTLVTTQISASRAANKTPVDGLRAVE